MQPQPQNVSAIVHGKWVYEKPSKYFDNVEFRPTQATHTEPLPLQTRKQERYEDDELTQIFSKLPESIQLPAEIIDQIHRETKKNNTHELRDRFSSVGDIIEFNRILSEFLEKKQRNELDLDYIPFHRSGCTSFFVAFVEQRCIQMAKRTYSSSTPRFEQQLDDLRNIMLFSFAIPRRDNNNDELMRNHLKMNDEEFIDNINCSIERVAKLCFTVIDTAVAPRETFLNQTALQLLDNCCDQFLTIIKTPGVRYLKQKTIDRVNRMIKWLFQLANDGVEDDFESYIKSYYRNMMLKINEHVRPPAGGPARGPAGGAKSKNKSNKKINSNKNKNSRRKINKNSRRKINKNSRRKINKNKKKTLRLRIKK
jgi:hypothetical protein